VLEMKKLLVCLVSLISLCAVAGAADEVVASVGTPEITQVEKPIQRSFELSLSTTVYSKYLGSDGEVWDEHAVSQTCLSLTHASGLYANVWTNQPLTSKGCSDEVDWTVGWTHDINHLSLNIGVAFYDIQYFGKWSQCHNVLAPFVEVSTQPSPLLGGEFSGYVRLEADYIVTKGDEDGGGLQATVGYRYSRSLTDWAKVRADVGITLDDGIYGFSKNEILFAKMGIDFKYKSVTFGPDVQVYHLCSHSGERAADDTNVAVGFTVNYAF
jgi:Bacterial protein of unknown function (Gcw_chp)